METKGKEKRGTSPSFPTEHKRSTHPPDQQKPRPVSADHKPIPNYLKPTISSGLDPSSKHHYHTKKQSSTATIQPNLIRRRSFDKLPSPQPTKEKNLRSSSSFKANKTISPSSTLPKDRIPKSHPPNIRTLKKNSVSKVTSIGDSQKPNIVSTTSSTSGDDSHITDPNTKVEEDQELSPITHEVESNVENICESPVDENLVCQDTENLDNEEQVKMIHGHEDENELSLSPKVETEESAEIHVEEVEESTKEEEDQNDQTKEEEGGEEHTKPEEVKEHVNDLEEAPKKEDKEKRFGIVKRQGSRKEYNDVIEETASKLREQRKNKVKALVGAFETVISLEESDADSSAPRSN